MTTSCWMRVVLGCTLGLAGGVPGLSAGESNRVLRLNGRTASMRVVDGPSLHAISSAITVETWFKAASFPATEFSVCSLVRKNPAPNTANFFLRFRQVEGGPAIEMSAGDAVGILRAPVALAPGEWYHLAGTYDGKFITVFLNGVMVQRSPCSGALVIDASDLMVGRGDPEYSAGEFFHGDLDEIRLWKIARSEQELRATMNTRVRGTEPGLVACWNFDQGGTADLCRPGLAGTLEGGAQIVDSARPAVPPGEGNFARKSRPAATPPVVIFEALCQALRENYPMLELVGWQEEWVRDFRSRIEAAANRAAAFELMDELVCRLNDYHTHLSWPGRPRRGSPDLRVEPVLVEGGSGARAIWDVRPPLELPPLNGIVVAVTATRAGQEVKPGDEIVEVNGEPVHAALQRAWRHSVGSSAAGKLRAAAESMLMGAADVPLRLRIRREDTPGGLLSFTLSRTGARPEEMLSSREVAGVPVIRIPQWSNVGSEKLLERFDADLERWRGRPGLILDVRGNGGGSDGLADQVVGRFLQAPIIASISFRRLAPGQTFERMVMTASPRGPWRYEGRVAVLIDEGCMSACEHFVSGMIEAGAVTCGTPTSGACGWTSSIALPGGARLQVSQTYPLHTGGVPSPLLGIPPHLWAPRTLVDVRAGKDTALDAALRWVRGSDPLPLRLQAVAPLAR